MSILGGILMGFAEGQARDKLRDEEEKRAAKLKEKQDTLDYFKQMLGRNDLSDDALGIVNQGYQAAATGDWGRVKKIQEAMNMLKPSTGMPQRTGTAKLTPNKSGQLPRNQAPTAGLLPSPQGMSNGLQNLAPANFQPPEEEVPTVQTYQKGGVFKTPEEMREEKLNEMQAMQEVLWNFQKPRIELENIAKLAERAMQNEASQYGADSRYAAAVDSAKIRAGAANNPTSQSEDFLLDGNPVKGEYVPSREAGKGKYFYNGEDVTSRARPMPRSTGSELTLNPDDPEAIAQSIMQGLQPPDLKGMYRVGPAVRGALARHGFDLMTAQKDWIATQKHLATLNGAQQERLRQAVTFTYDSLDVIENLFNEWKAEGKVSGVKLFNKANLFLAKQVKGKSGAIAQALESQINDLTSELGTVYKGGNSSTDESLKLAAANLKADWNEDQFKKALGLIRTNLRMRKNSIFTSQPAGLSSQGLESVVPPSEETQVRTPDGQVWIIPRGKLKDALSRGAVEVKNAQ